MKTKYEQEREDLRLRLMGWANEIHLLTEKIALYIIDSSSGDWNEHDYYRLKRELSELLHHYQAVQDYWFQYTQKADRIRAKRLQALRANEKRKLTRSNKKG